MRTDYCGLIDTKYLDQTVTLCGWVHRRRDHGGVIFIDLRDRGVSGVRPRRLARVRTVDVEWRYVRRHDGLPELRRRGRAVGDHHPDGRDVDVLDVRKRRVRLDAATRDDSLRR